MNKAYLAVLFIASNVFLSIPTAQANVFDPLLRVLLPSYEGDDDIEVDENHNINTSQPSSSTTDQSIELKRNLPNESAKESVPDNQSNSEALSESVVKATDKADNPVALQIFSDTDAPIRIINQPSLPLSEPSLYQLLDAEFAYDRGDIQRAINIYKHQAFGKDATAIFERALTLSLAHEDIADSLEFASTWQQKNPDHVPAWFYVAHLALRAHEYDIAGNTLEKILEYDPKADFSQILQGIYPETDNDKRALLATLQALYSKENANLSILKSGLLLEFNETENALIHVNYALAIEPDKTPFITLKADILRQLNNKQALFQLLSDARKRLPDEKALYLYEIRYRLDHPIISGQTSEQQDNLEQAWQLLMATAERFSDDPEIILLASLVSLDTQHYAIGDKMLASLLDRPAYIDQAYYYLGVSAERQNQYKKAKDYFANVMQENLVLEARKKVVAYFLIQEDTEAAINTLISLRRDFGIYAPDSYILQADILQRLSKDNEARALLIQANLDYPNSQPLQFAYAKLLNPDNAEDYSQRKNILTRLRRQEPQNLDYQLEFAKLLLIKDPNSFEGKQLALEVIDIPYTDSRFNRSLYLEGLNILSTAELALDNYTQVVDYLQTPYEILPTLDSGILLLQAYRGLKDNAKADKLFTDLQQQFDYQINSSNRL